MFETGGAREAVAELSAAVADAGSGVPSQDWVDLVGECQQLVNALAGVQTVALARLAALEEVQHEDGTIAEQDRGLGHQRLDAPALVSDLLGLTDAGAAGRVEHAVRACARIPELVAAMRAGRLDCYRAAVVSEELVDADAQVCAAVMAVVGPHLGSEPAGALRRRVRRVLAQVAPDLVRVKAAQARSDRALRRWTHRAGVDEWSGTFPVEQARPAWAVIDKLAKAYVADGRCTNLDQGRADALMDLVHGRASGTFLLQVAISAADLADHTQPESEDDELVEVAGLGIPGITHVSRAWLDSLPGAPFTTHTATGSSAAKTGPAASTDRESAARAEAGNVAHALIPEHAEASALGSSPTGPVPAASCLADKAGDAGANQAPALSSRTLGAFLRAVIEIAVCDPATGALLGRIDRITHPGQAGERDRAGEPDRHGSRKPGSSTPSDGTRRRRKQRKPRVRARGGGTRGGYAPPAWMAALVKARDGGCRFPGCTTAARFCDLDHVTAWPLGPTAAWNLLCLCRRHHRIKQRRGWAVHLARDGTATWTDPTGRVRTTAPQNLLGHHRTGAPPAPVRVEPASVPANHPVAFGIEASESALEEDLDLAVMLHGHQDAERRRHRGRRASSPRQATAVDDDRPPPGCRTRPRPDFAHLSVLRTWTLEGWPEHHRSTTMQRRPAADDPPPF